MSYAVTFTSKNEYEKLRQNIKYHSDMGCEHFYLFLDNSTDKSASLETEFENVSVRQSQRISDLPDPPQWLERISSRWSENMDVRKRLNTYVAARDARREGISWLASIDADELLFPSAKMSSVIFGEDKLSRDRYDQILVRNVECIPFEDNEFFSFGDHLYFTLRKPLTESMLRYSLAVLRAFGLGSYHQSLFEKHLYTIRFWGRNLHQLRDENGKEIPCGHFLGYRNFKSIISTARFEEFEFNLHKWQAWRRKPRNLISDYVLHYDITSSQELANKFAKRPKINQYNGTFHRNAIARMSIELGPDALKDFFANGIMKSEAELQELDRLGMVFKLDKEVLRNR